MSPLVFFSPLQNTLSCSHCPPCWPLRACVRRPEASTRPRPGERSVMWSDWRELTRWKWSLRCGTLRSLWPSRQLLCNSNTKSNWRCSTRAISCPPLAAQRCTSQGQGPTLRMSTFKRRGWEGGSPGDRMRVNMNKGQSKDLIIVFMWRRGGGL